MFTTTERRGPHKSMHCKFCKPPGTVYFSDIPAPAMLETKTNLHLCHEVADLKVYDVYDEPGFIEEESEACICQLEGAQTCPKCAPDKSLKPVKKKVCECPVGAKWHPNMANLAVSKKEKKKKKEDDDEFWWEKYDREHDARVKEIWTAYMAQRKLDKKLTKQKAQGNLILSGLMKPPWFHKLSCQQERNKNIETVHIEGDENSMKEEVSEEGVNHSVTENTKTYLEYLSTAIRLDLDEKITDRTSFVLRGIGFYPRATKKMLEKCLRYCHYNSVRFLNQLWLFYLEEDPYGERILPKQKSAKNQIAYSWNDRIIMACICHLEFPELFREIMDRLPPLPQDQLPPYIPKLKIKRKVKKHYDSPYDEPVWTEQVDWSKQRLIDKRNDYREYLSRRRVKIPNLALVKRPSLIDARPPFLSQIEASQSYQRRRKSIKKKKFPFKKKKKATFDSKVDITAIAGIEASEVSTTPKADPDEICMFLRDRSSETEFIPEEERDFETEAEKVEEQQEIQIEPIMEPKVKIEERMSTKSGSSAPLKTFDENSYVVDDELDEDDEIPFVTPPKTHSGRTIEEPCPPPKGSPGPPATHFDEARREIGLINEEICVFDPNEVKSDGEEKEDLISVKEIDIESQLKQVVKKLKELNLGEIENEEEEEKDDDDECISKISRRKRRRKKKIGKKRKDETNKKCKTDKRKKAKLKKETKKVKEKIEEIKNFEDSNKFIVLDQPEETEIQDMMEEEDSSEGCICKEFVKEQKVEEKLKKVRKKKRKRSKKKKKKKKIKKTKKKKATVKENFDPCKIPEKPIKIEKSVLESNVYKSDWDKENAELAELPEMQENGSLEEIPDKKEEEEDVGEKIFYGEVLPLLEIILKDLNEEGFISAGFDEICSHPDIVQLMKYLHGEILTKARKNFLMADVKALLGILSKKKKPKIPVPDLNVSMKRLEKATWNDKNWLENLAKKKKDIFYFHLARCRNSDARDLYLSLHQEYFGTERFLNSFYAYMIAAWHESIVKGLAI